MADQTIRGKCQNLFGTDRATVRIYAEHRRAERLRLSKICRAAGATWNTLIGAASFAGFKSTASFPITALISVQHDLVGKPDSTFPDHALISAEHDLVGKPDSTFPDRALKRAIRR